MPKKQTTTISLNDKVKYAAKEAGINISCLTEKALVEELELFSGRVPYSQDSYEQALSICKEFKLDGHKSLIRKIACSLESQYQRYVEDHEYN